MTKKPKQSDKFIWNPGDIVWEKDETNQKWQEAINGANSKEVVTDKKPDTSKKK